MTKTPSDPNRFWNARYAEDGFSYGKKPNDFLREQVAELAGGAALALAEGEGRNAVFMAAQGMEVTAVDVSSVGLANAQTLAASAGVSLTTQVADLAEFDLGHERWNTIVSIWAHLPPKIRKPLHRQVVEALAPGGTFLLEAYTPAQIALGTGGPPAAALLMTADSLREELAGLEFIVLRELRREVAEGKYHNGLSEVVQVLARKPV